MRVLVEWINLRDGRGLIIGGSWKMYSREMVCGEMSLAKVQRTQGIIKTGILDTDSHEII